MLSFLRRALRRPASDDARASRRQFVRRAAGLGAGMTAGGLLLPHDAWADAHGRPDRGRYPNPFIGSIILFGGNYAPAGWAFCNGQLLDPDVYPDLYSVLGVTYGGDGRDTFALPDLRGRVPIHFSSGGSTLTDRALGASGGTETISESQMPAHTHALNASPSAGTTDAPGGAYPARPASSIPQYGTSSGIAMASEAIGSAGSGAADGNMPPFLALNFIIAVVGDVPPR